MLLFVDCLFLTCYCNGRSLIKVLLVLHSLFLLSLQIKFQYMCNMRFYDSETPRKSLLHKTCCGTFQTMLVRSIWNQGFKHKFFQNEFIKDKWHRKLHHIYLEKYPIPRHKNDFVPLPFPREQNKQCRVVNWANKVLRLETNYFNLLQSRTFHIGTFNYIASESESPKYHPFALT